MTATTTELATLAGHLDALDAAFGYPLSLWVACAWCGAWHPHPASGLRPGAVVERQARCPDQRRRGSLVRPRSESPHVLAGGYRVVVRPEPWARQWRVDTPTLSWRIDRRYPWPVPPASPSKNSI